MKLLRWVAGSRKDRLTFPDPVRDVFGYALYQAQLGRFPGEAKVLKGFGGAEVLELRDNWLGDTYRAIYTVRFPQAVYVLHCFQKKSTRGIATPQSHIDLIRQRLKLAEADARRSMS